MFDRSSEKKQAKALRHEVGQQKCKIYQRSSSTKFRNTGGTSFQPSTGQFLVKANKELKLTTNLEKIVKDKNPSSASHLLSLNASRRNSFNQSNLPEISKDNQKQESLISLGIQRLKSQQRIEKTSYLVKSRVQTPKFTQGYRIVKLDGPNKLKISQSRKEQQPGEEIGKETIKEQANFLPVEYYLLQDETPKELMERYRIKESNYVLGFSRWYDLSGNNNWKKCRVLGYNNSIERWEIEWLHNNKKKEVSRINLYFEGQSKANFQRRVALAHKYRALSEVYYKYNNQINEFPGKPNEINRTTVQKIISKIYPHYPPQKIDKLIDEVKRLYVRSNHQAQFNASLPFDPNKRRQYEQHLPKCLFIPNEQFKLRYNISPSPVFTNESVHYFSTARNLFKERTSLNISYRLLILEYLNNFEEQMQNQSFVSWRSDKTYLIDEVVRLSTSKTGELIRRLNCAICDIEHHIGHELDQLYVDKKAKIELFESSVQKYSKFLSMITLRLEGVVNNMISNTITRLDRALLMKSLQFAEPQLKIQLNLRKRQEKIYYQVTPEQIKSKIDGFIKFLMKQVKSIPCPSKSYLKEARQNNTIQISFTSERQEATNFDKTMLLDIISQSLLKNCQQAEQFATRIAQIVDEFVTIASENKKQVQKRYNFAEIYTLSLQIKDLQKKFNKVVSQAKMEDDKKVKINIFIVKVDDVINKLNKNFSEVKRDLYRNVLEKILKDNQKIEKMINSLEERLEKPPTNIIEMLALEKLIREEATEQMDKIYAKIKEIPSKIQVLESIESIQYKDYEACNKIYVMPIKLKQEVLRVKRELENTYRKKFGEQLNKDATRVLQTTRQCSDQLLTCLKLQSLDEMCEKFMVFSNLNERLELGIKEAQLINDREEAMTWARTDFTKLFNLKQEFAPYFSLISHAKVYQIHLELLSTGPFNQIDYPKLEHQLKEARFDLAKIRQIFTRNPKMSRITCEVQNQYNDYGNNLPLIKYLRNGDLRQRHWSIIRQILTVNPLDEAISLKILINLGAKLHISQLQEISSIASRELFYEKKLIKLKRQWKEIKLLLAPEGDSLRTIINIKEIRQRVQQDILQIQQILSASFIKFLQSEIICWRNQVLYKAYELLQKWEKVQNEVCLVAAIFSKNKAKIQLPGQYIRFQILEKVWRGLCSQIDSQPWFADILQGKAYDLLTSMESSIERIKKHLYTFFQDKKREYARLGCISDDQFMNLLSCDEADPKESAFFEQTIRKCFQNIKTLIRNERHQIIKIRTKSNEEIPLTQMTYVQRLVEFILPNELIMELQKKIQRQLRSSLQTIVKYPHNHITQVLLLYQRLNFTLTIEQEINKNHCISAAFIREIELYRDDLVNIVLESSPSPKNQCQLLQALYHLQITSTLWQQSSLETTSFSWLSQPRTYLKNDDYYVEVGILTEPYGFEIVDLDHIITEQWSARIFCSYAGVIREKGFCLIEAGCTVGKTSSIRKLAALFGHKQFILDSNPLVSPRNLLQYIRMAASGMWVVLRNVQRLTQSQFSLLSRNIEVCWFRNISHPNECFSIQGTGIAFKSKNMKIFATIDSSVDKITAQMTQITEKIKKYFRVIYLPRINIQYVVQVKLLILGLQGVSSGRICAIVNYLKQRLYFNTNFCLVFSDIYMINKLFSFITIEKGIQVNHNEGLIDHAVHMMIDELIREESVKETLKICLNQNFKIRSMNYTTNQLQRYKDIFTQFKLYYNQNFLQVYHNLSQSLNTHNFIILLGPSNSGKSRILSMILHEKKIDLTFVCPNAYEIQDLYGNDFSNGVICSLIEDMLKKIKNDNTKKRGILMDGEIDLWMQPLAGIVSSGHIIQPNGNTLLIQEDLKFIFECKNLSNVPPTLLLYSTVLILQEPIKWQNLFTHYLNTKFSSKYQLPLLIKFLQLFIPYIVDPIIQFYESTCNEYITNKNHCYIPSNSIILSLLNLFETLLDYHFLDIGMEILNEKICSDCFNLFVMAVVWTVGGVLPEQSRKSFTRHFKYLIKRAVQVNIQGVNKQSLPDDDHDLFKVYYSKDRWVYWNNSITNTQKISPFSSLFVRKPEDIGLSFIVERYLEKSHSVYLLGVPSSQKVAFLESILTKMNVEVFNIRRLNFNPNSKVVLLKNLVLKQMGKEKYSSDFKGFVHGKKTLISIRDLNIPLIKQDNSFKVGLLQFVRHYYVTNGWYLKDSSQHFSFQNIVFCGTINIKHPLPINLQKYSNLVFRSSHKDDLISAVGIILENSSIKAYSEALVPLIINLHYAVCRELSSLSLVGIYKSDALCITRSLIKMDHSPDKIEMFRRWMFISEKVYQQKLMNDQSERLFYLVNNVLMEEEKIRYKSIRPKPSLYQTYFAINLPEYYNMKSIRKQIEQKCGQAIEMQNTIREKKNVKRKQSKIQQFASSELNYKMSQFVNHLTKLKEQKPTGLKDGLLKIIAHIINTFELQTSFLLSLSLPSLNSFSALDLEECLQVVAVIREAKLVIIKLGQPEAWNNNMAHGTWKDIILGVIQQILSSIQRGDQLKEVIVYFDDFRSENDYILDDLTDMKRMHILPYGDEVNSMLEYFLDNFKQLHQIITKKDQHNEEQYYGIQSKAKLKEKKYQLQRKERERNLKSLQITIISKLRFVININETSIQKSKTNKILEQYSDALRQFSLLNLNIYSQASKTRRWKPEVLQSSSLGEIKSKTIITDFNKDEFEEDSEKPLESEIDLQVFLDENEQDILQHIIQKMIFKNSFSPENQWQRSKQSNLKVLYMQVKQRLKKLCEGNVDIITKRTEKVSNIQQLSKLVDLKLMQMENSSQEFEEQYRQMIKEKNERFADYQRASIQNRTVQRNILGLKREKDQLQLVQQSLIAPTRKMFCQERDMFIQIIKQGKQKKVTTMNHVLRVYLQALGALIEKKIKKDEQIHKEILKDIFSPIGNTKMVKKISAIGHSGFYNCSQRTTIRIKEWINEIQAEKKERRNKVEQIEKEETYLSRFVKGMSLFFVKLIAFFDVSQQKDVKQIARRLVQNERATEKLKENQTKTLKSKQYLSILQRYEEIKFKQAQFQAKKTKNKNMKKVCEYLKGKLMKIQHIKYPTAKRCSIQEDHSQCTFLCWVKEHLLKYKDNISEIEEEIQSYALTIAIKLYYVSQNCENDILTIMAEFDKYRQTKRSYNKIQYLPSKLANLFAISTITKMNQRSITEESERQLKKRDQILEKYFESGNLISLIQFTPGIIVLGIEKENLKLSKTEGVPLSFETNGVIYLFKKYLINGSYLTKWLRRRNLHSYHKVCLSSRVTLENKSFMKSAKSIVVENEDDANQNRICVVVAESREELKSQLKVVKRQQTNRQLTVVFITENQNISFEENVYSMTFKREDLKEFSKQVEKLLITLGDKSQSSINHQFNEIKEKKGSLNSAIYYALDVQDEQVFNSIINSLSDQNGNIATYYQSIKKAEANRQKISKESTAPIDAVTNWISNLTVTLSSSFDVIKLQENLLKQSGDKRKNTNLNDKIAKYIVNIFEMFLSFQRSKKLPKMLSTKKCIEILDAILERNKQLNKKGINILKAYSQIKFYIWNCLGPLYPQHFMYVLMIFVIAEQEIPYCLTQVSCLLELCVDNYQQGCQELKTLKISNVQQNPSERLISNNEVITNSELSLINLYLPQIQQQSQESIRQSLEQNIPFISDKLTRKLKKVEKIIKSNQISTSFEGNYQQWKQFLSTINENTKLIPETLLLESNVLILYYLVSLIKPTICFKWLKNIDSEGFHKRNHHISTKKNQIKLYDSSYCQQWNSLISLLFYQYTALNIRNVLLADYNPVDLIQVCVSKKISFAYYDFTTVLWQINKALELKQVQQREQMNYNELVGEKNKESAHFTRQYQNILENIKASLKSQTWVIINLNYCNVAQITMHEYFKKIHQLLLSIMEPDSSKAEETEYTNKGNKHTEKQHRSMVIYVADMNIPDIQNQSQKSEKDRQIKSRQQIINSFLHMSKSFIYFNNKMLPFKAEQMYENVKDFKYNFFSSIFKSPKGKKQYEKMTYCQKIILIEYILISHLILQDFTIKGEDLQPNIKVDHVEELMSRIHGCTNIIKSLSLLTEQEEKILSTCQDKNKIQTENDSQLDKFLFEIEEYIILLIEYTFQLNFKTSLLGKRVHCTLQYVFEIKKYCQNLKNVNIESILSQFQEEQKLQQQRTTEKDWNFEQSANMLERLMAFHSEGLSLQAQQAQKDSTFRQQQEKLLQIFVQESKLSFSEKMQEISSFEHEDFDQLKSLVERLKLYDTKQLYSKYKYLWQNIDTSIEQLQSKYAKLIAKSKYKGTFTQTQNPSTIITNAITQLFNREAINDEGIDERSEISQLEEIFLRLLISLKKKVSSLSTFLESIRDLVKEYIQIQCHNSVKFEAHSMSSASQDEDQNMRNAQEQQLKALIKKKIQTKILVERLVKKISVLYSQIDPKFLKGGQIISFKQQKKIYESIELVGRKYEEMEQIVNESIGNYLIFQKQHKEKMVKLQDSLSAQLDLTDFIFNFGEYSLGKIIQIMKITHAKKHHQEFHLLQHTLKLTHRKSQAQQNRTNFYFRNFRLINAKYFIKDNMVNLEAALGNTIDCKDLLVEVVIEQQCDVDSEDDNEHERPGFMWYKCPFYLKEGVLKSQSRERVHILIKEIAQFQIVKTNIYLIA